jgi:hypothetical protein
MRVTQLSVFMENKAGRIAEVTSILAEAGINIKALSIADTSDFGVLRMIVDKSEKALKALNEKGLTVGQTDVLAIEVEDKPGGLHRILELLQQHHINVEYMYAFVQPSSQNAVMIFRFDHLDEAINVLSENGINVLKETQLFAL